MGETAKFTDRQVRHMFFEREQQRCFYCRGLLSWTLRGSMVPGGWSAHHRIDRGMGGRGKRVRVSCADGLILCGTGTTGCHGYFTERKQLAIELGISIPRNATTAAFLPTAVRVRDKAGRWFLLTENGRLVEVDEGNTR